MNAITTRDGAEIFYKDWGSGQPIVFSHGWPLNSDAWDDQLLFFSQQGFRAIAHDRRGHGRSSQTGTGNDMDTYADDLAALVEALDLHDIVLVGHSTGGGEVARYIGRHGTGRVAKAVLVGAITPGLLKSDWNPNGSPIEAWNGIRAGLAKDRSQFYLDLAPPFYGANRAGAIVSQGIVDQFWRLSMQAGLKNAYDCTYVWETDFRQDLARFDIPTLVIHGSDDQIVPVAGSAQIMPDHVAGAELKIYLDAPHGLPATHKDQFNADLLAFIRGETGAAETARPELATA